MLLKDPRDRISASEALKHPWLNQNESDINDEVIDFAKNQ